MKTNLTLKDWIYETRFAFAGFATGAAINGWINHDLWGFLFSLSLCWGLLFLAILIVGSWASRQRA